MASSARIEELKKKFDENPRRYFAPLANEYRKAGELDQAIAICQEYLPQQPGHMSGHIVYGQALFESARMEEARTVFETALTLDPENLIALRHLGDIARTTGDVPVARGWYQRVLDADPRNEEIAALLAEVAESVSSTAPTPLSSPAIPEAEEPAEQILTFSDLPTREIPAGGIMPKPAPAPEVSSSAKTIETPAIRRPSPETPVEQPLETTPEPTRLPDLEVTIAEVTEEAQLLAHTQRVSTGLGIEREEGALDAEDRATPMSGIDAMELEPTAHDATAHKPSATGGLEGLETTHFTPPSTPAADLDLIFDEPAPAAPAPAAEEAQPTAGLPLLETGDAKSDERPTVETPVVRAEAAPEPEPERGAEAEAKLEPAPEPMREAEPEPAAQPTAEAPPAPPTFVTETMAELYLRQGHRERAISIYRELVAKRPDDEPLRSRLSELETEAGQNGGRSGPSIRDFLMAIARRSAPGGVPVIQESDSPAEAQEPPDESHAMEMEMPASADEPSASDAAQGSIDALFGGGGDRDDAAAERLAHAFAMMPPQAAAAADAAREAQTDTPMIGQAARQASGELSLDQVFKDRRGGPGAGFSFDQFFSQAAKGGEGSGGGGGEAPSAVGSASGAAGSDDDIQQFNSWLEGLKKT